MRRNPSTLCLPGVKASTCRADPGLLQGSGTEWREEGRTCLHTLLLSWLGPGTSLCPPELSVTMSCCAQQAPGSLQAGGKPAQRILVPCLLPWQAEAGGSLLPPAWDSGTPGHRALLGVRFRAGAISVTPSCAPVPTAALLPPCKGCSASCEQIAL